MKTPNEHLVTRLDGVMKQLMAAHSAGRPLSSASKGREREIIVNDFLSQVFPSPFRFGSGDAIDSHGRKSGQLDVVIEYPFSLSIPLVGSDATRLYLAESVAAVVEVKSDLASQWDEAVATAKALRPISRKFGATMHMGPSFEHIPLFVVGYQGWKKPATLAAKIAETPEVGGILVIEEGLFHASESFGGISAHGALALWGLILGINLAVQSLKAASPNPLSYCLDV